MLKNTFKYIPSILLTIVTVLLFCSTSNCQDIAELIDNGGYIFVDENGKQKGLKQKEPFLPASTVKVVTSLAALKILGKDYRFTTTFYYDKDHNLFIVGGGDPLLVSEEIDAICNLLHFYGIRKINSLTLDDSLYALSSAPDGTEKSLNPYDAHNSALAVNFNTVHIKVLKDKTVISAEEQTPTVPFLQRFNFLPTGKHRININQLTAKEVAPSLQYAGELFIAFLEKNEIQVKSHKIKRGAPPSAVAPLLRWNSPYLLEEIITKYLHSSSNFMTNQVFLQIGLKAKGAPATWKKSQDTLAEFLLTQHQLTTADIHMEEGSGLSRKTYMTPEAMIKILQVFSPHYELLSFSKKYQLHRKTGSLKGVYCLAGYIPKEQNLLPFVIFLNQQKNNRYKVLRELIRTTKE